MADLITLEDFKLAEGRENSKDDARLNVIIPSVSQLVKTYCANSFVDYYSVDKTEYFSLDWDTNIIQLTESPLVSVTAVYERDNPSEDYVELTEAAYEFVVDTASDSIYRTNSYGWVDWAQGPLGIKVVYKAGYSEIPADLKLAVIDLINYYHKDEYKEQRSIGGVNISNKGTTSQTQNVGFPDHIKRILDLYKQVQM